MLSLFWKNHTAKMLFIGRQGAIMTEHIRNGTECCIKHCDKKAKYTVLMGGKIKFRYCERHIKFADRIIALINRRLSYISSRL